MKAFIPLSLFAGVATARAQAPGPAGEQVSAGAQVSAAAPTDATVSIRVSGSERARLAIDGVDAGDLPSTAPLSPGKHRFEVSGETGDAPTFELDVQRGDRFDVVVELEPRTVPLVVTTALATAHIFIDGSDTGQTGRYEGELLAGTHVLELREGAEVRLRRPVVLTRGQPRAIELAPPFPVASAPTPAGAAVDAKTGSTSPPTRGGYFGLSPTVGASLSGQVRIGCGTRATCTTTVPLQFGAAMQTGYGFGALGLELMLAGAYEEETRTRRYKGDGGGASFASDPTVARLETFTYRTTTAFGGMGLRLRLGDALARFTSGLSLGAIVRAQNLERKLTEGVEDRFLRNFRAVGPAARGDLGVLVGERGGFSGVITVWTMVDSPSADARSPAEAHDGVTSAPDGITPRYLTPAYALSEGVQVAAGLSLGGVYGL